MLVYQEGIIILFAIINLILFIKGYVETKKRKNAYKLVPYIFFLFGIFAWGDAIVFGIFWIIVSVVSLALNDWILFLLIFFVFWVVRSLGETLYWFLQQFSVITRQAPKTLPGFRIYHNDSVWFACQIVCQCITVVSLIVSIYLLHIWLG